MSREAQKIAAALSMAFEYGQIDGAHHKAWVIDQMVRALLGESVNPEPFNTPTTYAQFVQNYLCEWDEGIAP